MTETNNDEVQRYLQAGRRKISTDKGELLAKIEEVRTRLEVVARERVESYQQEYAESAPLVEESYRGVIQPFWNRIVNTGVRDIIVAAGYVRRGGQIMDTVNYHWPSLAMRALTEGGIFPDRLTRSSTLKQLYSEATPCVIDAWTIVEPQAPHQNPEFFEENTKSCYEGNSTGFICLDKAGLVTYKGPGGGRYDWEYYAFRFNPSEDRLVLPEHVHPKVINEFAAQIKSGRSDEYVGALLVRVQEKGR